MVERAETPEELVDRVLVGDVEEPCGHAEIAGRLLQPVGVPPRHRDGRAASAGVLGDGTSDAGRSAEDDEVLSLN